jgi:hypothetical protein
MSDSALRFQLMGVALLIVTMRIRLYWLFLRLLSVGTQHGPLTLSVLPTA